MSHVEKHAQLAPCLLCHIAAWGRTMSCNRISKCITRKKNLFQMNWLIYYKLFYQFTFDVCAVFFNHFSSFQNPSSSRAFLIIELRIFFFKLCNYSIIIIKFSDPLPSSLYFSPDKKCRVSTIKLAFYIRTKFS